MGPDARTSALLDEAGRELVGLDGHILDVISIRKPLDGAEAIGWAGIVSKLSPLLGNLLEFEIVRLLNGMPMPPGTAWVRQDPGFPDAAITGLRTPPPGVEIKAWFPLATEITGRFRESQARLADGSVRLAVVCWLPEYIVFGKPVVLGTFYENALAIAKARDDHYHDPPAYLVFEPEDTTDRGANLQQTNTNGFRFQEDAESLAKAKAIVAKWPNGRTKYALDGEGQALSQDLANRFRYRLDTNFAKIDRIGHTGLASFKSKMLAKQVQGKSIEEWATLLRSDPEAGAQALMDLAKNAPD